MKYDVRFFRPEEFLCPCCRRGRAARLLVLWLDLLRRTWGGPVRVNSGFRCGPHNAEVGGAKRSRHLCGCAADIAPLTPDREARERFFEAARRLFDLPGWEVRRYPSFIHVAAPASEDPWEGGAIDVAVRDVNSGIVKIAGS